uniref:Activation-induced cytidine deaminase AID domain-containing protein n=1 Tax=Clytia hemisphaerica TaxID=252671 RepID=A0A7M5V8X3_9CNID
MSALSILDAFVYPHGDPITWAYVKYSFESELYPQQDDGSFCERSRNSRCLYENVFDDVPPNEMSVYHRPLHAEKYVLERLRIKLSDLERPIRGNVTMFLSKSPCVDNSRGLSSCVSELEDFCSDFDDIEVDVVYASDEHSNGPYYTNNNLNISDGALSLHWKQLINEMIYLLQQEDGVDNKVTRRLKGIARKKNTSENEILNVLKSILKDHFY